MKSLKLLIGAATVAAVWSSPASAAQICNGCNYIPSAAATYIGSYTSTTFDFGSFVNAAPTAAGATDTWIFDFAPSGSTSITASFTPSPGGLTGFSASLYAVSSSTCATFVTPPTSTAGTSCTAFMTAPTPVATGAPLGSSSQINNTPILAGRYAIQVTYTAAVLGSNYSGQLSTNPVPEPGSLALVGAALFGAAVSLRKRKAA